MNSTTPQDKWKLLRFALLGVVVIVLVVGIGITVTQPKEKKGSLASLVKPRAERPSRGDINAPVQIIEYSDFECPYCKQEAPVLDEVFAENQDAIRIEYRHFPIYSKHPRATPAAMASECAHEQGKFWKFHDLIFENQKSLSDQDFVKYAKFAGLRTEEFWNCYSSSKYLPRVSEDYEDGQRLGISATPTFYVNGVMYKGALSVDQWRVIIAKALTTPKK